MIRGFTLTSERDVWRWREASGEIYYVSYAYSLLLVRLFPLDRQIGIVDLALRTIWYSLAPSEVLVFSW